MPRRRKGGDISRQTKKAKRFKICLNDEATEETSQRLSQMRERDAQRRADETQEETSQRLSQIRERIAQRRADETQEETSKRLSQMRERDAQRRGDETQEETSKRLSQMRERDAQRRADETQEETSKRLSQMRKRDAQRRADETQEERSQRLSQIRENRENESQEQRDFRLSRARESFAEGVANELPDRRSARLQIARGNSAQRRASSIYKGCARQVTFSENNFIQHSCGSLNVSCQDCGAWHFAGERPPDGKFTHCCHKGKVQIRPAGDYPTFLRELLTNPEDQNYANFKQNIRSYNSALAFASMGAQIEAPPGHGPWTFRVHGQIYHLTTKMQPPQGRLPSYAQLYILDSVQAVQNRMDLPTNQGCDPDIMRQLDDLMRVRNPYANGYRMLKDIYDAEAQRAQMENRSPFQVSMLLKANNAQDQRCYNLPTANEVAMVFVHVDGEPPFNRDIRVYPTSADRVSQQFQNLSIMDKKLDPFVYPIFYPRGEDGWHDKLNQTIPPSTSRANKESARISMLQFKQYQINIRNTFNPVLYGGKLLQQWLVDSHLQVVANNLNYIRNNQGKLRTEQYKGLMDYIADEARQRDIPAGRRIILPSSFSGSPRAMRERYQDAMSMVRKLGKPTFFLTFTCNHNWSAITKNLKKGQTPSDRPDLVARVFKLKLKALLEDITKNYALGKCIGHVYTIEFQKRGLPHSHHLIWLSEEDQIRRPDDVDKVVSPEIPDINLNPRLYDIVTKFMIHGPCDRRSSSSNPPCWKDGKCSKNYPKPVFSNGTVLPNDGYPIYRRRETPPIIIRGCPMDNRNVVSYNAYLSFTYNAHVNLEVCTSIKCVKYLFKYIFKGYDCATVSVRRHGANAGTEVYNYDEINQYIDARYVTAPEAVWHLFENEMHGKSHAIIRLAVHLPDQRSITFPPGGEQQALEAANQTKTTLQAWFVLNEREESARQYLYPEIPHHYVFHDRRIWKPRKQFGKIIGRMFTVCPADKERFYLRLLLLHVRGARSFDSLRTVNNVVCGTFQEAARQLNLIRDDGEWNRCLEDATATAMPRQIRQTFAFILIFCQVADPVELWTNHKEAMMQDFLNSNSFHNSDQLALLDIKEILIFHGKSLATFNLPEPDIVSVLGQNQFNLTEQWEEYTQLEATLNPLQREAFYQITTAVQLPVEFGAKVFFLDGPGGSGKTYLYNALMCWVRGQQQIALPHATTGIAALLLRGGRTAHSGFKLPVPIIETSTSSLRLNDDQANLIRQASILIIDEASMLSVHALRCINLLLQEIMANEIPFGGKALMLGGDFRQTLPVVPRGNRTQIVETCIKRSPFWHHFTLLPLVTNMRAGVVNTWFNNWLILIGNGTAPSDPSLSEKTLVEIPQQFVEMGDIITSVFGNQITPETVQDLANRVVLTTKNEYTFILNERIMNLLPTEYTTYFSADIAICENSEEAMRYEPEFIHRQTPSGMPPHELKLKIGTIVMLLRNLTKTLCNGTRLIVKGLHANLLDLEILTGVNIGDRLYLPRLDLAPTDTNLPFVLSRRQFPVRPAFAMTINKAQGQTFDFVGGYLPESVFAHGQLYTLCSRVRSPENLKIYVKDDGIQGRLLPNSNRVFTKNIVYPEVLN